MASPMVSISHHEVTSLIRQVRGNQLLNRQLSSICQINGLKSTGVKADLQRRIMDLIQETANLNDVSRFQQIRQSISNASAQRGSPVKGSPGRGHPAVSFPLSNHIPPAMPGYSAIQTDFRNGAPIPNGQRLTGPYTSPVSPVTFRPSPFYQIETPISGLRTCEVMSQHRNSIIIPIKLSDHPSLQHCVTDPTYRVMIFCASELSGVQNITFPHQSELRVNGGDVKANLRGLKNKPGSTRPVDITNALRLRHSYINNVEFTYALTTKKFYLIANLCKVTSVSELVSLVSTRRRIPKASVMKELNQKAQDPDVIATSQVLSLKCPLSYMRLDVPCRSLSCSHIQCFDATSYLQLQEQGPLWLCPICNKPAPFEQLAIDEYVKDILDNTHGSLEAVTIEPDGRWFIKSSQDENQLSSNGAPIDDDDELEISEVNVLSGRQSEAPKYGTPGIGTPNSGQRDRTLGAANSTISGSGAKRPAPVVIDLTLSSDDEEPIQRPRKRQQTETNGLSHGRAKMGFFSESPIEYPL